MSSGMSGRFARLKISGIATAFANETCSDSGDHQTYQIDATAKRVWDPTAAITVKVGGSVTGEQYTLNRLTGKITFATINGGRAAVTVTGTYLPLAVVARARAYTYQLQATNADDTDFDTAFTDVGFQRKIQTQLDFSGTIAFKWSSDVVLRDTLLAGVPVVIEIFPDRSQAHEIIAWCLFTKSATNMAIENTNDGSADFTGTTDADGRVVSQ